MFIEIAHAATEAATTEAAPAGLLGTFGINLQLFLAQLLNFAIVVFVLSKWVFKPLLKTMEQRKKVVEEGIRKAEQSETVLKEAKIAEEQIILEARDHAKEIVDEGKAKGEYEKQARIQKSAEIITAQLQESKQQAVQMVDDERKAAKAELAELIGIATEKVAGTAINDKAHRTLIDQAIRELEQSHG